jgi:hypothetical protein
MKKFTIILSDICIWNYHELLTFLITNQKKDVLLHLNFEGVCLTNIGLYKLLDQFEFKSVTIVTSNWLEKHSKYKIVLSKLDNHLRAYPKILDNTIFHQWNNKKIFGVFFNRPTWYRIGIATYLNSFQKNKSLIHFISDPLNEDKRSLFELQPLFRYDPTMVKYFINNLDDFPKIQINDNFDKIPDANRQRISTYNMTYNVRDLYINFLIDIVAESIVRGDSFFPTEKITRPILLKKPFIIMGSRNYLNYIKQLGFKTFGSFWDESYDYYDNKDRYLQILNLIEILSKKELKELQSIYQNMQEILDHNYNLLINRKYLKSINYVK